MDSHWQPATLTERYRTIDIIRGLALFGVLMVNLLVGFRLPLLEHILHPYPDTGQVNRVVDLLVAGVLEFKALTIFSFLFGVGIAIQVERAASRNVSALRFMARRLAWLFIFGLIHMFLIWNGDILTLYAVCGMLLLPALGLFRDGRWPLLLVIGAVFIKPPEFFSLGLPLPASQDAVVEIARAHQVYGTGSLLEILGFRWHEAWTVIVPLLVMVLSRTAGLMYWGMAAWRSGILREPERHRRKLAAALLLGGSLGAVITVNELWKQSTGNAPWPVFLHTHIDASILVAMAYVAGLLLLLGSGRASQMTGLASVGQMALTNYLTQSIVLGFIFYGYGLGLFGRLGSAATAVIGVALYVAQVQFSRWWLGRFRFGPFEWLWRCLSYGQWQPFVIAAPIEKKLSA